MTVRQRIAEWLLAPAKASTGIGAQMMQHGTSMSVFAKDPRKAMAQAQRIGIENLYIRAAERVIGDRFSTIAWHLEDEAGDELVNDAVQRIMERPYVPRPGDPISATPQTRSGLWRITCRHLGLTGNAFWFLDQTSDALTGWPLDVIYINPSRMSPAEDEAGNLLGWVLDADAYGHGTPLETRHVIHFRLEPPDYGHYGVGLVESAFSRAEMLRLADRHANDVLASGGRLAGIFAPSAATAGSIPEDQYQQLVKDIRTVSEAPDAARRALVLRGPIEYTKSSASPAELDLAVISELGRDGLLDLWGVPLSQLSGQGPGGMNSGETRKYDEASLWQNGVGPRLRAFRETVQFQLFDRLEPSPQLIIEEPAFDDEAPRYDLAQKAISLPLTNEERRAILGMEPLGDDSIDKAIWVPINIGPVASPMGWRELPAKARTVPGVDRVREQMTAVISRGVSDWLDRMKAEVVERVVRNHEHLMRKPNDTSSWWEPQKWERELSDILRAPAALAAQATYDRTRTLLEGEMTVAKAELRDMVLKRLLTSIGERISGILDTTRDKVRKAVETGIADGMGAAELGRLIEESAGFGEYRAEVIARTETNRILNLSQLYTYNEFGVDRVQAIDGDEDEECAARNGQVYTTAEAQHIFDHPNGTLDWMPLVLGGAPAKAALSPAVVAPMPSITIHNHPPGVEIGPTFVEPPKVDIQNIVEPTPITVEGATVINEVQPTPVSVAAPTVNVTNDVQPSDITIVKEEHKADDDGVPVMTYIVNWPEPKAVKVERDQAGRVTGARQVE